MGDGVMEHSITITRFRERPDLALTASKVGPVVITSRGRAVARLVAVDAPRAGERGHRDLCGVLAELVGRGEVSPDEKRSAVEQAIADRYLSRR